MLISHGMSILRVPLLPKDRPAPGRPIYIQVFQAAVGGALSLRFGFFSVRLFDGCFFLRSGIDIDCDQGRVYWSDVNGHSLRSARYDGSDHDVFLNTGQRCLGSTTLVVVVDVVVVVV